MAKRPITPAVAAAIGGLFAAAPALAVSDLAAVVSAPSEVAIGTPLEVTWGAENVGDAVWFGGAVVDLFISIDPVLPNPKLQAPLVSQTVSAFPPWQPGARRTITSSFGGFPSLAAGVPAAGTRYFIVNVRDLDDNAANNTVIAPFTVRNPQLTVVRSGTGNGTVSSRTGEISCGDTCQALFPPGANVELDAMPAADSSFLGWSGDCTGSGPCSVTMNGDRQVGAEFALALSAEFDFSPAGPQVGQPVQFTDLSTGDPDSWTWEFGDGEVSAQQHPSHSYSFPGEFTARLTVSWAGVSDTTTRVVPVTETTALSTAALSLEVEAVREGGDSVTVAVTREGAATAAASVVLAIHDESARRGDDYEAPATLLLEWAAGDESPRTVTITILDDDAIEEPEILGVELSAPQGLALGDPSGAVLLLLDDDFVVEPGEFATAGPAESPAVAAHVDGSRAYVWQLPDSEGNGAFARAFERNGASIGEPFALASDESADPRAPSVAWDDNGNLVVLWLQEGGAAAATASSSAVAAASGVLGATFTPEGEPLGPPVEVSDGALEASNASISTDRAGEAVVIWHEPGGPRGRLLDREHRPAGDVFAIDDVGVAIDSKPAVDRSATGDFVVVWLDDLAGGRIRARLYDPHANPRSAAFTVVADPTGDNPVVALADDGDFVIAWDSTPTGASRDVSAQRFDHDGQPLGDAFLVHDGTAGEQRRPRIDANSPGDFVITFESDGAVSPAGATVEGGSVLGRFFDASGEPLGDEVEVVSGEAGTVPGNADVAIDDEDQTTVVFERRGPGNASEGLDSRTLRPPIAAAACGEANATSLCLQSERFTVTAQWQDRVGRTAFGRAAPLTTDTGTFWFFEEGNIELVVRVLDACAFNGHFWVFAGGLTDLEVNLVVDDVLSGVTRTYFNPPGRGFEPILDTSAFATCDVVPALATSAEARVDTERVAGVVERLDASAGEEPRAVGATCVSGEQALCLGQSRFEVRATWRDANGNAGDAGAVGFSPRSGYLWFFGPSHVELVVKVLEACPLNDSFWVFAAGPTDVEVELVVTDTETGATRIYENELGRPFRTVRDTSAFPCL